MSLCFLRINKIIFIVSFYLLLNQDFNYFLGRASIVGYNGQIILDIISKPDEPVTDHRTRYSGLTQTLLEDGVPINEALFKVRNEIQV